MIPEWTCQLCGATHPCIQPEPLVIDPIEQEKLKSKWLLACEALTQVEKLHPDKRNTEIHDDLKKAKGREQRTSIAYFSTFSSTAWQNPPSIELVKSKDKLTVKCAHGCKIDE